MRLSRASSIAAIVGLVAIAMGWTTTAQADDVQLTPIVQSVVSPPRWYAGDDGRVHLQYELDLTNTVPLPVDVVSVEVLGDGQRVELIDGTALLAAMAPLGSAQGETTQLPGSSVAVVWLDLRFDSKRQLPERLRHRLTVDVGEGLPVGPTIVSTGGAARVVQRAPVVIGPPLAGGRWIAVGGAEGPHRRALQAVDGHLGWVSASRSTSRRCATPRAGRTSGRTTRTRASSPTGNRSSRKPAATKSSSISVTAPSWPTATSHPAACR